MTAPTATSTMTATTAASTVMTQRTLCEQSSPHTTFRITSASIPASTSGAIPRTLSPNLLNAVGLAALSIGWACVPFVVLAIVGQAHGETNFPSNDCLFTDLSDQRVQNSMSSWKRSEPL